MIPDLCDIGTKRKVLPLGRYECTLEEVKATYVPEDDNNRQEIWSAFLGVVGVLRSTIGVIAEVWIGGSFITSEEHPHDIDVVFLIRENVLKECDSDVGKFLVNILAGNIPDIRRIHDLVDGYILIVPPTEVDSDETYNYMKVRGYWDQFWSKARFDEKEEPRWLYPAAGYLEVTIDGYDA